MFPLIYGHSVWRSRVGAPYSTEYYFLLRVLVHVWASGRGKQVPSTLMEYEHHCVRSGIEYVHHVRCRGKQYCHVRYQYPYPSSDFSPNRPSSGDSTVFSHLSQASTSYPCLLGSLPNPPLLSNVTIHQHTQTHVQASLHHKRDPNVIGQSLVVELSLHHLTVPNETVQVMLESKEIRRPLKPAPPAPSSMYSNLPGNKLCGQAGYFHRRYIRWACGVL